MSEENQPLSRQSLSQFDAIEQPLLFLDANHKPFYLSAKAARLLEIRGRTSLSEYAETLAPLITLGAAPTKRYKRYELREHDALSWGVQEIDLKTPSERHVRVLAFARPISFTEDEHGTVVVFHDLSVIEPFLRAIDQSRKNRAFLVLTSSYLGRPLTTDQTGKDLTANHEIMEREFFKSINQLDENRMNADLLTSISTAVDIVDPFIVSSAKMLVDAKMPALLRISQPNFLRIVAHILLESADFVGPYGTIRIKSQLTSEGEAEISFLAEKATELPLEAGALDLYLYRRYMPLHYRVSLMSENSDSQRFRNTHFGFGAEIADQSLSENLTIVASLAKKCGVPLQIKRPKNETLVLCASFALLT